MILQKNIRLNLFITCFGGINVPIVSVGNLLELKYTYLLVRC